MRWSPPRRRGSADLGEVGDGHGHPSPYGQSRPRASGTSASPALGWARSAESAWQEPLEMRWSPPRRRGSADLDEIGDGHGHPSPYGLRARDERISSAGIGMVCGIGNEEGRGPGSILLVEAAPPGTHAACPLLLRLLSVAPGSRMISTDTSTPPSLVTHGGEVYFRPCTPQARPPSACYRDLEHHLFAVERNRDEQSGKSISDSRAGAFASEADHFVLVP